MGLRIDCKTEEGAYELIRENLEEMGYTIFPFKKISYGLQFEVSKGDNKGLIRVYNSKDKGVNVDLSVLKNEIIKKNILSVLGYVKESINFSEESLNGNFYSLCIGINEFDGRFFSNLNYAKKDAEDINNLINNKFGLLDEQNICLLDGDATKKSIIEALKSLQRNVKPEDTLVIFIATHGEAISAKGLFEYYIIPYDVDEDNIKDSALSMRELREIVSKINSDKKVMFLDTCYSGGISRRDQNRVPEHAIESLFNEVASENFVMISSSQPDQPSHECNSLQQGVFTHFLLNGLTGHVESTKGLIDLFTLYIFLHQSVNNYTQKHFKKKQKPRFFGSITGPFLLPLLKNVVQLPDEKKFSFEKVNCIGIDESGKGDYFGPLVVAAVYVDTEERINILKGLGIKDSKKILDSRIRVLARRIRESCDHEVISISPLRYNELSETMNLNELLAWCHSQSLEKVLQRNQSCDMAISDQFAGKEILINKLKEKGKKIELLQRPKAEENIAVAAASILARERFLDSMSIMGKKFRQEFHRGASEETINDGIKFLKGGGSLKEVAKFHFKTTKKVMEAFSKIK